MKWHIIVLMGYICLSLLNGCTTVVCNKDDNDNSCPRKFTPAKAR